MEEILNEIENKIIAIKEQQNSLRELTENSEKIKKEEELLKQEQDAINDKESGFYKDISEKVEMKHADFIETNNIRMNKDKEVSKLISEKKEEILKELMAKKRYIDENRNVNLEGVDLPALKAEKEKLEREIQLNNITKDEFLAMSDSEKREVRKAKENYLNNKHRLNEINPTIELMDILEGDTPRDKFMEIEDLEKFIDKNFNEKSLDKILENVGEKRQKKIEEIEQQKLLDEMISGREKGKERYNETIREAVEQEKVKEQQENKKELTLEEKIDKLKQDMENANNEKIALYPKQKIRNEEVKDAIDRKLSLPKDLQIEIGRTGKIHINGQDYKIGKEIIKNGINLTKEETVELAKKMGLKDTKEAKELLVQCIEEDLIDSTVMHMVFETKMPEEDKKKIIKKYISDAFNAKNGMESINNCNITYKENDLSKTNLLAAIFGKEIDSKEKIKLISKARKANRYSMVDIDGEYKPNTITKIVNWFKGVKTPKLPTMEDMCAAANVWNDLNDKGEASKVNSYRYMKDLNLTNIQKQELEELHEAQIDQKISKADERDMKKEIKVEISQEQREEAVKKVMKETEEKRAHDVEKYTGDVEKINEI